MPSLRHAAVAAVLGRFRRVPTVLEPEEHRARLVEENRERHTSPPRWVGRRYAASVRSLSGPPAFDVHVLTPKGGPWRRTLLHLHGGSFTSPAAPQHWRFLDRIADDQTRIVVPAYPRAPEFTWRDSHDALVGLLRELLAESDVVLSGDSAGGGLALALAEAVRDVQPDRQPTHLVLLAPWVDLTNSAPGTFEAGLQDPWLNFDNLDLYARYWAGGEDDLTRWEVSPGLGDLRGLPSTLMLCGTRDLLYPGCVALAERAEEAGWPVEFVEAPGLLHVYPLLPIPEARPALRRIRDFLGSDD